MTPADSAHEFPDCEVCGERVTHGDWAKIVRGDERAWLHGHCVSEWAARAEQ